MANPWLGIPLADYEGHMGSPEVGQLAVLSSLFETALRLYQPRSVAILGVAGGNGLEQINSKITQRVVGLDFNQEYLENARSRFSELAGLELHCVDLAADSLALAPVELVHAALVFEHAGVDRCLENALALVENRGAFSVVLQLPSETAQGVGASPFPSLQKLKAVFQMIEPAWLKETLHTRGFALEHEAKQSLPAGKSFWHGIFRRSTVPGA